MIRSGRIGLAPGFARRNLNVSVQMGIRAKSRVIRTVKLFSDIYTGNGHNSWVSHLDRYLARARCTGSTDQVKRSISQT